MENPFRGSSPARDSDAYKTIEGAAYTLAAHPDPKLEKYVDDLIIKIAAAQESDGYLYTARRITPPDQMPDMSGPERWTRERTSHETYVMGLLHESGVAWFQATGKRSLLDVAIKNANFLSDTFGPRSPSAARCFRPRGIVALVRLYRATGDDRYLRLSQYFVDQRGTRRTPNYGTYAQDHKPVIEQTEAVGHAVRAGYLYCGVTDLAALTGNSQYIQSMDRIWHNRVDKRMYLTGGLGARRNGEAFGNDYELPNLTGYNETCAAVANAFWQQRLFLLHRDARQISISSKECSTTESLAGYRSAVTGSFTPMSSNPTAHAPARPACHGLPGPAAPPISRASCPPSPATFMPLPLTRFTSIYSSEEAPILKLGVSARAKALRITQQTRYPWDGSIKLTVAPAATSESRCASASRAGHRANRCPATCTAIPRGKPPAFKLSVNGRAVSPTLEKGYAVLRRTWKAGDTIELNLPMPIHRVLANEGIEAGRGRVALERGPLIYCAEGIDNGGQARTLVLPADAELVAEHRKDLLGGITVILRRALRFHRHSLLRLVQPRRR